MDWLTREITTGFQKLLCLSLDRTPATDLIQGTVAAWIEALTANRVWDESRDTPRIRQAFTTLIQTRRTWPSPADFNDALPSIRQELKALPRRAADPAKVKAAIEEIAEFLSRGAA